MKKTGRYLFISVSLILLSTFNTSSVFSASVVPSSIKNTKSGDGAEVVFTAPARSRLDIVETVKEAYFEKVPSEWSVKEQIPPGANIIRLDSENWTRNIEAMYNVGLSYENDPVIVNNTLEFRIRNVKDDSNNIAKNVRLEVFHDKAIDVWTGNSTGGSEKAGYFSVLIDYLNQGDDSLGYDNSYSGEHGTLQTNLSFHTDQDKMPVGAKVYVEADKFYFDKPGVQNLTYKVIPQMDMNDPYILLHLCNPSKLDKTGSIAKAYFYKEDEKTNVMTNGITYSTISPLSAQNEDAIMNCPPGTVLKKGETYLFEFRLNVEPPKGGGWYWPYGYISLCTGGKEYESVSGAKQHCEGGSYSKSVTLPFENNTNIKISTAEESYFAWKLDWFGKSDIKYSRRIGFAGPTVIELPGTREGCQALFDDTYHVNIKKTAVVQTKWSTLKKAMEGTVEYSLIQALYSMYNSEYKDFKLLLYPSKNISVNTGKLASRKPKGIMWDMGDIFTTNIKNEIKYGDGYIDIVSSDKKLVNIPFQLDKQGFGGKAKKGEKRNLKVIITPEATLSNLELFFSKDVKDGDAFKFDVSDGRYEIDEKTGMYMDVSKYGVTISFSKPVTEKRTITLPVVFLKTVNWSGPKVTINWTDKPEMSFYKETGTSGEYKSNLGKIKAASPSVGEVWFTEEKSWKYSLIILGL